MSDIKRSFRQKNAILQPMDKKASENNPFKTHERSMRKTYKQTLYSVDLKILNYGQNLNANATSSSSYENLLEIVIIQAHQQHHTFETLHTALRFVAHVATSPTFFLPRSLSAGLLVTRVSGG